jgi:uncharacterized membrane protein YesL
MQAFSVIWRAFQFAWDELFLLVIMNVLTLLGLFTVVLGPPALAAMHAMSNRIVNGYAVSFPEYFAAGRKYFFKAWQFCLPAATLTALFIYNLLFYMTTFQTEWSVWVQGAWLALLLFWHAIQFYVFPFFMAQKLPSWRLALRNSALVAGANPLYTVFMLAAGVVLTVLFLFLLPMFVLFGVCLWTMFANMAVADRVRYVRERAAKLEERRDHGAP